MPYDADAAGRGVAARWAAFLPLVFVLPWIGSFIFLRGTTYSDLTLAHYPNLLYLHRAWQMYGVVPLWSPAIMGGFPLYANPLGGMWYPPGWLSVIWPEAWMFNLLAAGHLVFGAWGGLRWLEWEGVGGFGRVLGVVGFGWMPRLLAQFGAGHITLLYAVCWTPWLLVVAGRDRGWGRPGVVLGMIFLADPRWAVYAAVLWLAWRAAHSHDASKDCHCGKRSSPADERDLETIPQPARSLSWWRAGLREGLLALLLAGPLLLPLLNLTAHSTRAHLTAQDALTLSFPPIALLGLLIRALPGTHEWVIYPGAVVLVGAVGALSLPAARRGQRFWIGVAGISLLFALGDHLPVFSLWAHLPGASLMRVPARALILFDLALLRLAVAGYDHIVRHPEGGFRKTALIALMAIWMAILLATLLWDRPPDPAYFTGALFGLPAGALFLIWPSGRASGRTLSGLTLLLLIADLAALAPTWLQPRPPEEVFAEGAAAARWLAAQPGEFRVYSPDYSLPQHTAARYDLRFASGVDPLQLDGYAAFITRAAGLPDRSYSIPLPPLTETLTLPDATLLGLWNVRYLLAAQPLQGEGWELVHTLEGVHIYENQAPLSPLWLVEADGELRAGNAEDLRWTPNRIEIQVQGPAEVVLAEPDYPDWVVEGGELLPPFEGALRRVAVNEGKTAIAMSFRPLDLYIGLVAFAAGVLIVARSRREPRDSV